MTADLISRARDGDGDAFRALTEPYRRELHVHCYRMLASVQDAEDAIVGRFVRAYESADVPALVALFTDHVFLSMPPMPLEYQGRELVARFFDLLLVPARRYSLVPTRANGMPAFGAYVTGPDGARHATGLFVVSVTGDAIRAMTRFETGDFGWFGLPLSLPAR